MCLREGLQQIIYLGFHHSGVSILNIDEMIHYIDWPYGDTPCKAYSALEPDVPTTSESREIRPRLHFVILAGTHVATMPPGSLHNRIYDQAHRGSKQSCGVHKLSLY